MDAEPGNDQQPPEGWQPSPAQLQAYVEANAGKFTDAALMAELTKAGYATDDIRAALAEFARGAVPPPTRRAVVTILIAYGLTFAVLSLGMIANTGSGSPREFIPNAIVGILVLAGTLGFALMLSLVSVGSRRVAGLLFAGLLGLTGAGSLGGDGFVGIILLGAAVLVGVLALRSKPKPSARRTATLGALLALPVVLLVIVAGLCIATGLPIPRNG